MKSGITLQELATQVREQQNSKRDFIVPATKMRMRQSPVHREDDRLTLEIPTNGHTTEFGLRDIAHDQLAQRLSIPRDYYKRMMSNGDAGWKLLCNNVNHWLDNANQPYMVRTIEGDARAILSDRYRRLDNLDLMEAAMPTLMNLPGVRIESCQVTEQRLYIKAVLPSVQGEVKVGDTVQAGIVISNSEIGMGSVKVEPLLYRLICLNGAIMPFGTSRRHIGRGQGGDDEFASELFSDETKALEDKAFWHKVQDVVRGVASEVTFGRMLTAMQESTERTIEPSKATDVVELATKRYGFYESEKDSVLGHLISGGDLSQYGLGNAVTAMSQEVESYDRATELERIGGGIFTLGANDWKALAN